MGWGGGGRGGGGGSRRCGVFHVEGGGRDFVLLCVCGGGGLASGPVAGRNARVASHVFLLLLLLLLLLFLLLFLCLAPRPGV